MEEASPSDPLSLSRSRHAEGDSALENDHAIGLLLFLDRLL